jgi:hypothetical protein
VEAIGEETEADDEEATKAPAVDAAALPATGLNFARLQKLLASQSAVGVRLISITTDPKNDTPARLKKWAEELGWEPGWLLLTGSPNELEPVLIALTGDKGGRGLHSTVALIANVSKGVWIRTDALEAPERLAAMIDQVRGDHSRMSLTSSWTLLPSSTTSKRITVFRYRRVCLR